MTKIAIHQPNFIPWFPFFYKMAMVDIFVILTRVQFEKGGYQNRFNYKGKWITKPVKHGLAHISDKIYANGETLLSLNMRWIEAIAKTLDIRTMIIEQGIENSPGTQGIIEIVEAYQGDTYITNPEAKDKYLDEKAIGLAGIDIEYCTVPKHLQRHAFEIIEEYGITGAIRQLPKRKNLCAR